MGYSHDRQRYKSIWLYVGICSSSWLIAAGVNVSLCGPLPTPGVAYLTKSLRQKFGVVISASHNDFLDNGIKIFNADGEKLSRDLEKK